MTVANRVPDENPDPLDRRARRKQDTRARIAGAAMELFGARGYDAVAVTEVARAAGVTEKTVFNHFATKEALVFDQDAAFESALVAAVRDRGEAVSVVAAVREFLLGRYRRFPARREGDDRVRMLAALIDSSPALQRQERAILARYSARLRDEIARELGVGPGDLRPAVVADALIAVHQAVVSGFRRALHENQDPHQVGTEMLTAAEDAFAVLSDGLARFALHVENPPTVTGPATDRPLP